MKKTLYIIIVILILGAIAFIIHENYKEITVYLNNKEWEIVEPVGTVNSENYYDIIGTASNLNIIGSNYIKGYSNNAKEVYDESVVLKGTVSDSNGDYCIIGEKDGTKLYMINGNVKIWENNIQGSILDVSVNKNGYSTIIYKQTGYKSLVKVLKPDGSELFTNYLASTYAVDVAISNDNKVLAIAEIDAEGIKAQSSIKLIDMTNIAEESVKRISTGEELVIRIEFNSKNELLVQMDNSIKILKDTELITIVDLSKAVYASIENGNNPIVITKIENGLFDTNYILSIYEYRTDSIECKELELEENPSIITSSNKSIALLSEGNLYVVNTNAHIVKRCEVTGSVKLIVFFDNGNALALVYRDKIEFFKI